MSQEYFTITRKIEIDAGHRLPFHESKCRNMHGHRYVIEAYCSGKLASQGSEQGMVMDFTFLKEEMLKTIDEPCDHGFIIWSGDGEILPLFFPNGNVEDHIDIANEDGYWAGNSENNMKIYIMSTVPTAENLAKHWYERLRERVSKATKNTVTLEKVKVWETPNCSAEYPA